MMEVMEVMEAMDVSPISPSPGRRSEDLVSTQRLGVAEPSGLSRLSQASPRFLRRSTSKRRNLPIHPFTSIISITSINSITSIIPGPLAIRNRLIRFK